MKDVKLELDNKQIDKLTKELEKIYSNIRTKEFRDLILSEPAKLVQKVAQSNIFDAHEPVHRYEKHTGKKKAKGEGKIRTTYYPGNLRRSIKVRRLRNAFSSLRIGPKYIGKGKDVGDFKGGRTHGGYAYIVEYGIRGAGRSFGFMRRAWLSTETRVKGAIIGNLQVWVKKKNSKISG